MAYTTRAEVRALDLLSDTAIFTDAKIDEAIAYATAVIDRETRTSWEAKSQTKVLDGNGRDRIFTGVASLRSVTSSTIDAVVQVVTAWKVTSDGMIISDTYFTAGDQNVSVTFTAGAETVVPSDIAWACRTIARHYLIEMVSRVPDSALSVQTEFGLVQLAQPGKHGPTPIPQVNDILASRRHLGPRVG